VAEVLEWIFIFSNYQGSFVLDFFQKKSIFLLKKSLFSFWSCLFRTRRYNTCTC